MQSSSLCPVPGIVSARTQRLVRMMQTTAYFDSMRTRPDRATIKDAWIERTRDVPIKEMVQADGRIRRWSQVPEAGRRRNGP